MNTPQCPKNNENWPKILLKKFDFCNFCMKNASLLPFGSGFCTKLHLLWCNMFITCKEFSERPVNATQCLKNNENWPKILLKKFGFCNFCMKNASLLPFGSGFCTKFHLLWWDMIITAKVSWTHRSVQKKKKIDQKSC